MSTQELIVIEPETALTVYTAPNGLDPYLAKVRDEIDAFIPDLTTRKGREEIASIAHKVAKSKTYLDKVGKELVDRLKEQPKLVDAERKRMRDTLDAWKDEVRKPLTDWEDAEKTRVARHEENIAAMKPSDLISQFDSAALKNQIDAISTIPVDESWEEFEAEAHRVKAATIEAYKSALVAREKYDAEQAELARLRQAAAEREQKEREERIAREAAEKAKRDAEEAAARAAAEVEAKAKADREAAERRELEAKLSAERAEREKLEAERREKEANERAEKAAADAKAQAERAAKEATERAAREAEEQRQREVKEAEQREANKRHAAKINNEALAAFIAGGMPEECAKLAVTLIAKRSIPNVTISY